MPKLKEELQFPALSNIIKPKEGIALYYKENYLRILHADGTEETIATGTNSGGSSGGDTSVDLSGYYTSTQIDSLLLNKQNTLVSGSTIKTINGISLLGSGDITITGGSDLSNYYTKSETYSKTEVDNLSSKVTFRDWTIDS